MQLALSDAQSTMMSVLFGAASLDDVSRRFYLERFCRQYTQPLVDYLRYARGVQLETAQELVQEFWTFKLLEPGPTENLDAKFLTARAENVTTGFRQYLCRSLTNFFIDRVRKRERRGEVVSLDAIEGWEPQSDSLEQNFDVVWATHILNDVVVKVRSDCEQQGQLDMWQLFVQYTLREHADANRETLADLAAVHGFQTAKQASNALQTISRKFRRALKNRIADYMPVSAPEDQENMENQEIAQLLEILSKPGGVSIEILRARGTLCQIQEPAKPQLTPSVASFGLTSLVQSERDYGVLWTALLDSEIADWVSESGVSLNPKWQGLRLSDLTTIAKPDLELLERVRDHAKGLGIGTSKGNSQAVADGSTPMELLAAIYLTAIAIARIQHSVKLTSSSDPTLRLRIEKILD